MTSRTKGSWRFATARALTALGGGLYLLKMAFLLATGVPGPVSPWRIPPLIDAGYILAYAIVGVAGVMAAARPPAGAMFAGRAALAGALGLLLDLSGITTPLWLFPGTVMLVSALVALRTDPADVRSAPSRLPLLASRVAVGVGLLALTVPAVPLLAIGLGVPGYGMLGLYGVWALLIVVAIKARHAHPWLIPAFPPTTLAITYRLLLLGGELFGWSA